jgi:hypothetical protein
MHFSAGEVWNDIQEVCDDSGVNLDNPRLRDLIHDEYESNQFTVERFYLAGKR